MHIVYVNVGVVTFCRNLATPIAAEEGLTGILSSGSGTDTTIKNYGDFSTFMEDEVQPTLEMSTVAWGVLHNSRASYIQTWYILRLRKEAVNRASAMHACAVCGISNFFPY